MDADLWRVPCAVPGSGQHVSLLANADPEHRKAVYNELNLAVVYHDNGRMQVSAGPDACTNECVGGGLELTYPNRDRASSCGNQRP